MVCFWPIHPRRRFFPPPPIFYFFFLPEKKKKQLTTKVQPPPPVPFARHYIRRQVSREKEPHNMWSIYVRIQPKERKNWLLWIFHKITTRKCLPLFQSLVDISILFFFVFFLLLKFLSSFSQSTGRDDWISSDRLAWLNIARNPTPIENQRE